MDEPRLKQVHAPTYIVEVHNPDGGKIPISVACNELRQFSVISVAYRDLPKLIGDLIALEIRIKAEGGVI